MTGNVTASNVVVAGHPLPMDRPLLVSEVFGPTVQGEGPFTGRRCGFIRLGLCNLDCSWCDTPYTWDWLGKNGPPQDKAALYHATVEELVEQVIGMRVPFVVITGGEPLVQQAPLIPLAARLMDAGVGTHIETNGTQVPTASLVGTVDHWSVSPKLPSNSGVAEDRGWKPGALRVLVRLGAAFKVVCRYPGEVAETVMLTERYGIPADQVWVMPEGQESADVDEHLALVAESAIAAGFNITPRLHVQVWGNRRGV